MAGRTHGTESISNAPGEHGVHHINNPAYGVQSNLARFLTNADIAARELSLPGGDDSEDILDIRGLVTERDLGQLRASRGQDSDIFEGCERLPNDDESFGTFRMPDLRYVMREKIVKEQSCLSHTGTMPQVGHSLKGHAGISSSLPFIAGSDSQRLSLDRSRRLSQG
jgi:hypothetical protein